ncbi:hypothetical protein AAHA92_14893 [Salvia divinorum]|uniref:Uncharacterized protein n=1 Tax=Salvia divinorum TaxID=28513 RepID=A0ABD1HD90_SALDI
MYTPNSTHEPLSLFPFFPISPKSRRYNKEEGGNFGFVIPHLTQSLSRSPLRCDNAVRPLPTRSRRLRSAAEQRRRSPYSAEVTACRRCRPAAQTPSAAVAVDCHQPGVVAPLSRPLPRLRPVGSPTQILEQIGRAKSALTPLPYFF